MILLKLLHRMRITAASAAAPLAAAALLSLSFGAAAQSDFPSKPIRIIVPFTAGSGADAQARLYAQHLQADLKQNVLVENKPGANGVLALDYVKMQPADGYTLTMGGAFLVVNPVMMKSVSYKPADFQPVAGSMQGPIGLVVGSDSPYHSVAELLAAAKAQHRPISMASYTGTYRLAGAWLAQVSGVPVTDVPYKGAGPVLSDLIGGHVEAAMVDFGSTQPLIREGKIRVLAVTSDKRLPDYPNVPTLAESYPGYELHVWTALVGRSDIPSPVFERLVASMTRVLNSQSAIDYAATSGFMRRIATTREMKAFQAEQFELYRGIAEKAGIQAE
jgi:tripartite-type tricarboxylate transporter receptor subunit TctC